MKESRQARIDAWTREKNSNAGDSIMVRASASAPDSFRTGPQPHQSQPAPIPHVDGVPAFVVRGVLSLAVLLDSCLSAKNNLLTTYSRLYVLSSFAEITISFLLLRLLV